MLTLVQHVAFTFDTLDGLLLAYRQRKARGILPMWCVNHGPTTSLYYQGKAARCIQVTNDELTIKYQIRTRT